MASVAHVSNFFRGSDLNSLRFNFPEYLKWHESHSSGPKLELSAERSRLRRRSEETVPRMSKVIAQWSVVR